MAPRLGDRDAQIKRSREWERRPGLSRTVHIGVVATPIAASFGVAALLSHVLPRPDGAAAAVLSAIVIAAASMATLLVLERAARRLLPLAALLNLSLIFPDKAPARFSVARRTGRPRDLRASLVRAHEDGNLDDEQRMRSVIELVLALSVHDRASRGHSERVRVFTDMLADELKVPDSGRNRLRWAALLHDIGKLEVPAAILTKPATPSAAEWDLLHRHPEAGARLVSPLLPWLGEWGLAVEQHHERFDGTGYPHRLRGHGISLAARIVAVADAYEVMTAPRPYKRPMSVSAARKELVRVAGTQLDPVVVRAFLNVSVGRLWRTTGLAAWIAQIPQLGRILGAGAWAGNGMSTGMATATTAAVLAVGGVIGPGVLPAAPALSAPAVALAPAGMPAPRATSHPARPARGPVRTSPAAPAATRPTPAATAAVPTQTSQPAPSSTPTTARGPATTPNPTPSPTPMTANPCARCTNGTPSCTSYCRGANPSCLTWCAGNSNTVCTSHCFGNHNIRCLTRCVGANNLRCSSYCEGANNPVCLRYCSALILAAYIEAPPLVLRQADTMLATTMSTTNAMVMRPLY